MATPDSVRALEEAYRASEARLTAVVESLPFDLWIIDLDGRYVMENSRARELWGDFIGKRPEDLAEDEATLALWQDNNRRALAGETVRAEVQFKVHGELRHYYNVISPIWNGQQLLGIIGINFDITTRKLAEEALARRNQELCLINAELEELSQAKDRLTAVVSHELRTPLVTGLGYVEMLLAGKLGPLSRETKAKMAIAQRNLRRLATLIDNILRYQELLVPQGCGPSRGCLFDLAGAMRDVAAEVSERLGASSRRISLELEAELPSAWGDPDLIHIVLVNLLNNALVHSGAASSIRLVARRSATDRLLISVADNGCGIPDNIRRRVFEPFVKADPRTQGHGLGLAVVQAILKLHGTKASLESKLWRGTTISFELATHGPQPASVILPPMESED